MPGQRSDDLNFAQYDPTTIWLHWTTVGLIAILWLIGQTADLVPRGPIRTGLWSVHVVLGFATAFVLLTRVAWRAHFGRELPPADTGLLYVIAKATHYALYLFSCCGRCLGHRRRLISRLQCIRRLGCAAVRDGRHCDPAQHQRMARACCQFDDPCRSRSRDRSAHASVRVARPPA